MDSGPPASSLPSMAASPAALMVSACSDAIAPAVVSCLRAQADGAARCGVLPMDRSPTEVRFNAPSLRWRCPAAPACRRVRRQVAVAAQAALRVASLPACSCSLPVLDSWPSLLAAPPACS